MANSVFDKDKNMDFSEEVMEHDHKMENNEYGSFMEKLEFDSRNNDAKATWLLGIHYDEGLGVKRDRAKALKLYELAVAQGSVAAKTEIADFYFDGIIVKQDVGKAFELYKEAALDGDGKAMERLSNAYALGCGLEKDMSKAFEWMCKAWEAGNEYVALKMGDFYFDGIEGVLQPDKAKAAFYYEKAIDKGDEDGIYKLATMYVLGDGIQRDVKMAESLIADLGLSEIRYKDLRYNLGMAYFHGDGIGEDKDRGLYYLKLSAEKDRDYLAAAELRRIYAEGDGVETDEKAAQYWCKMAVKKWLAPLEHYDILFECLKYYNNFKATERMAIYYIGHYVGDDKKRIYDLINLAASQGSRRAKEELMLYVNKDDKDIKDTVEYLEKSAQAGDANAMGYLSEIYSKGEMKDEQKSFYWMKKAADSGSTSAKLFERLGDDYYYGNKGVVKKDYKEALAYYEKAIEYGAVDCIEAAAELYAEGGFGIPRDIAKAERLISGMDKEIFYESYDLRYTIGMAFFKGYGVEQDKEKGIHYLKLAADLDEISKAARALGRIYQKGDGVEKDAARSKYYYRKSREKSVWGLF